MCWPHGQIHLVWRPVSERITQPCLRKALTRSLSFIAFGTRLNLEALDVKSLAYPENYAKA